MNTRAKVTVAALLSVFAMASNPAKADVLGFSVALPDLGAVTAEVDKIVAADVTAYMRSALSVPRVTRKHQSPTVTIATWHEHDGDGHRRRDPPAAAGDRVARAGV